ncbi:MAG: GspE/PulE family protein, partial [Gammaproteobacteria bacterium]|nr:GspE/PulE family protein [Gammaproteobacteria bacterium]
MMMQDSTLIEMLIGKGILDRDTLLANGASLPTVEQLLNSEQLSHDKLAEVLSDYYGLEYHTLDGIHIDEELFELLPAVIAHRYQCVPLADEEGILKIAISEQYHPGIEGILERSTGRQIHLLMASSEAILALLDASGTAAQLLSNISNDFSSLDAESLPGQQTQIGLDSLEEEEATVTKLINSLILDALQRRASDIHIELEEHNVVTKYRVDGVLTIAAQPIHTKHHAVMVSRLKVMAELDIAEKRIPQDGKFRLSVAARSIDFRVSILPGVFGEDVVIRILDKSTVTKDVENLNLTDLGFNDGITQQLRKAISEPYGMVLITGPTGSGKTTTLYAALSELNDGRQKIITIEDPVEYYLQGIVQIPVNEKKQLTFSKGLRSILRHDPDKIMVGEIRDVETAEIAIQSSLTGHLVFSTVHANNVFDVIGRFSHMGVDVYNFVSALNCVMAQRLLRKICPACKQVDTVDDEYLEFSGLKDSEYSG